MTEFVCQYDELSKADQKRLTKLSKGLGIPLFPFTTVDEVKAILREDQLFFNDEPICSYNGGLAFGVKVDVIELLHDIAHVLVLGPKLWAKMPNGVADFGDIRWHGEEEIPCMFLQVEIGKGLQLYKDNYEIAMDMDEKGYGFGYSRNGQSRDAKDWFDKYRLKEDYKKGRKLKSFDTLLVRHAKLYNVEIHLAAA